MSYLCTIGQEKNIAKSNTEIITIYKPFESMMPIITNVRTDIKQKGGAQRDKTEAFTLKDLNHVKWDENKIKDSKYASLISFKEGKPYIDGRRIIYYKDVDRMIEREMPKIWGEIPSVSGRERTFNIVSKLYIGLPRRKVFLWMKKNVEWQRSQPILKASHTDYIVAPRPDALWQLDAFSMVKDESVGSYTKVLVIIDNHSKYLWLRPMKTDSTEETIRAFKSVLAVNDGRKPKRILTDKGSSFTSRAFKAFLDSINVRGVTTRGSNPEGNSLAEVTVRTCKLQLYSLMGKKKTDIWSQFLPFIEALNRTSKNRTTLETPDILYNETSPEKHKEYEDLMITKAEKRKFQIRRMPLLEKGDRVRVAAPFSRHLPYQLTKDVSKKIVHKAILVGKLWSEEVYTVKQVFKDGVTFRLNGLKGNFPREALLRIIT